MVESAMAGSALLQSASQWESGFALAAYSFALKYYQSKKALAVPRDIDPALWKDLKRQWPRLEREPQNRPAGAQTLSLENRWMYPASDANYRFVGFTLSTAKAPNQTSDTYQTRILEARLTGRQWRFRPLPPGTLPREAELVLYKQWIKSGELLLVNDSQGLVAKLRSLGINARPFATQSQQQGFLYVEIFNTWWTDSKTAYARVHRMSHPPGNDVSYELYGSVRLSRKAGRWTLIDLGDWQGE